MAERVTLFVYDLSQGMARSMSLGITGRQIDGIWHTSVVVFGREWFYGQGIMNSVPGMTMHGTPLERIDMGETEIPQEVFMEFMDNMRETYTADRYHLLDNTDFLQTPFGQMMRPMIENMFGPTQQPQPQYPALPSMPSNNLTHAPTTTSSTTVPYFTDLTQLRNTIATNKAVAVYFTSATCPPCRVIAPIYDELIQEKQGKVIGVKVDIGQARAIGREFAIYSTPTFVFFLNGAEFSRFSGANQTELRSSIDVLIYSTNPAHPHELINLKHYKALSDTPILFSSYESLDAIFTKLDSLINAADNQKSVTEADKKQLQKIHVWLEKRQAAKTKKEAEPTLAELGSLWKPLVNKLLSILPFEHQFPLLDIVRMLILHPRIAEVFAKDGRTYVLSSAARQATKQLLVHTLLSPIVQQRQAAASLAFDIGNKVAQSRHKQSAIAAHGIEGRVDLDDDWNVECLSAIAEAVESEESEEVLHRLVASIANFIYKAEEDTGATLLNVLGLDESLQKKIDTNLIKSKNVIGLCQEVQEMIRVVVARTPSS
ncbi:hypothetical protein BGW42_007092 [Actinomortierella wolfii]|nr:hypothetical protein BGW42_007092 [Actinomortierella wolfii]